MEKSALQIARAAYQPKLPKALQGAVKVKEGAPTQSVDNQDEIKKLFPNTYGMPLVEFVPGEAANNAKMNVGVILSGGQAPGGHNVITGLFDQLKRLNPENRLFGFILGPGGFVDHDYMELTADIIDEYRNTGGFDMRRVWRSFASLTSRLLSSSVATTPTPTPACLLSTMLLSNTACRSSAARRPSTAT